MTQAPVIVFLDFDGVLHRFFPIKGESDASNAHFAFLPAFEAAVRACPRPVEIVITSNWRNKYSLDELRAHFSEDVRALVVGTTPKLNGSNEPGGRLAEVIAWLEQQGRTDCDWVGVDDYPELYGEGVAVVACHDQFTEREHGLLLAAVADPKAYADAYPCRKPDGKITIITGISKRN